jgi:hypothetical protein
MRTLRAVTRLVVVGSSAWLAAGCSVEQPLPQCTVGRGAHAVRYELKSGTGACASKRNELVGAQAFRFPNEGRPPTLVLKPDTLARLEGSDPAHPTTSTGDFLSEYPSEEAVCEVNSLSEAVQEVTPQGGGAPVAYRYKWSNLRLHNTAAIPGTQWTAELQYTEGDCSATYKAVGVFPAISCLKNDLPDESLCHQPRPGLSLDPAFPVRCDAASGLCVLEGEPPALNP